MAEIEARQALALWYAARGQAEVRPTRLPDPAVGQALVRTIWSGISRGTERLVFEGRIPQQEAAVMRAPMQDGDFPFPVKYGYSAVGRVEEGPADLMGRTIFALHPHQDRFVAPTDALVPLPDSIPPRRAVLAANMETALNALWDSGAGPGDRVVVVGAGVVGFLVAYLAARLPGSDVAIVDIASQRRAVAEALDLTFFNPDTSPKDADIVFHTSATPTGLATAIASAGVEAKVMELSWYGDTFVPAALGGAFHSRRLQLMSSQVGQVSPSHRPRWTHARRLTKALSLLADDRLDALITSEVAFDALAEAMPRLLAPDAPGLATVVRYPSPKIH